MSSHIWKWSVSQLSQLSRRHVYRSVGIRGGTENVQEVSGEQLQLIDVYFGLFASDPGCIKRSSPLLTSMLARMKGSVTTLNFHDGRVLNTKSLMRNMVRISLCGQVLEVFRSNISNYLSFLPLFPGFDEQLFLGIGFVGPSDGHFGPVDPKVPFKRVKHRSRPARSGPISQYWIFSYGENFL